MFLVALLPVAMPFAPSSVLRILEHFHCIGCDFQARMIPSTGSRPFPPEKSQQLNSQFQWPGSYIFIVHLLVELFLAFLCST